MKNTINKFKEIVSDKIIEASIKVTENSVSKCIAMGFYESEFPEELEDFQKGDE